MQQVEDGMIGKIWDGRREWMSGKCSKEEIMINMMN